MNLITNPDKSQWAELLKRPVMNTENLFDTVRAIIDRVKTEGDRAVLEYEEKFDKVALTALAVTEAEQAEAEASVGEELKKAIRLAKRNIETFHAAQRFESKRVETQPGVTCWQKAVAIEKVGLYIPGGTAPLFSTVLMLGIPASIAGCNKVILCSPPPVADPILCAAKLCGIKDIYQVGGAQAIAAMAFGKASIPKVAKIFGPGNAYVTEAKRQVSRRTDGAAIDMPAGPSEVLVIADETANPAFVAADLLSQAEHGPDSQVVLVTPSETLAKAAAAEALRQLQELPRRAIAEKALSASRIILVKDLAEAVAVSNRYAPEHLILQTKNARDLVPAVQNAGSVFVGAYSPESGGDYATGTNHVLPTYGCAAAYSSLGLADFMRRMTVQEMTPAGFKGLAQTIALLAHTEELDAHRNAVLVRLAQLKAED